MGGCGMVAKLGRYRRGLSEHGDDPCPRRDHMIYSQVNLQEEQIMEIDIIRRSTVGNWCSIIWQSSIAKATVRRSWYNTICSVIREGNSLVSLVNQPFRSRVKRVL